MSTPPWWKDPLTAIIVAVIGVVGVIVAAIIARPGSDATKTPITATGPPGRPLTIYSSLPEQDPHGAEDKRAADMEKAIRLALKDVGGKAGAHSVRYVALDATDETGVVSAQAVAHNARRASRDPTTAVYIGDFSSGASSTSIPILSRARIPQISPASTRVGLTVRDPTADTDEPERYYPTHFRNFVRIIPNDIVQAAALMTVMRHDGCTNLAMINDAGPYGTGLASDMALLHHPSRAFRQSVSPNASPFVYTELARLARRKHADCFAYTGENNANTFEIFKAIALAIPTAKLYGTDGVNELSFREPTGTSPSFVKHVTVMVPPRDLASYQTFTQAFRKEYHRARSPDPYAIYAYEAARLALDAIASAGTDIRTDIRDELFATQDRDASVLGTYSIDDNGDTSLVDYDIAHIHGGMLDIPSRPFSRKKLEQATAVLRRRAAEKTAEISPP